MSVAFYVKKLYNIRVGDPNTQAAKRLLPSLKWEIPPNLWSKLRDEDSEHVLGILATDTGWVMMGIPVRVTRHSNIEIHLVRNTATGAVYATQLVYGLEESEES